MPGSSTHQVSGAREELIERGPELARLETLVGRARSGDGVAVLIEGAPGIGKTSLLMAASRLAVGAGMRPLQARPGPLERDLDFAVVRQLFRQAMADSSPDLLAGAAHLAATPLGLGGATDTAAPLTESSALHGLYWACANLADRSALIITVDDLHWADEASVRFLSYLARRITEHPILLCVASRPAGNDDRSQLLATVQGDWGEVLSLRPLSDAGVTRVISIHFAEEPAPEFCSACARATGGNPFLLVEAIASLRADGVSPGAVEAERVQSLRPHTVSRAILARIARSGLAAARVARAIAVLGSDARLRRVAKLADLDPTTTASSIADLVNEGILVGTTDAGFTHPLVRHAVDADLSRNERALAHLRAARILHADGDDPAVVSSHLLLAEPAADPWAVDTLRAASQAALARGSNKSAAALLQRALDEPAEYAVRPRLLLELGQASARAGALAKAIEALGLSLDATIDPGRRADVALELGRSLALSGQLPDALNVLEKALAGLGEGADDRKFQLENEIALVRHTGSPTREWIGRLAAVATQARGDTLAQRGVRAFYAYAAAGAGERTAAEVEKLARSAVTPIAGIRNDPFLLQAGAAALAMAGRFADALNVLDRALETARDRGDELQHALTCMTRTWVALRAGRVLEAEADARTGATGGPHGLLDERHAVGNLVLALIERDRPDLAEAALAERGLSDTREPGGLSGSMLFIARGRLSLLRARPRAAVTDLQLCADMLRSAGMVSPTFADWHSDTALAYFGLGEIEAAQRLVAEDLELSRAFGAARELGIALRTAGLISGGERGIDLLAESVETLEHSEAELERARSIVEHGAALRRTGRRSDARKLLARGLDIASRCGARAIGQRARAELIAAGAKPRRERLSGRDSLTASELRIARLAAEGRGNPEIAQALFVTRRTVEVHLTSVYRKLGIHSRDELPNSLSDR
jgi:DNA-binding CsgD family transcriptional regulator